MENTTLYSNNVNENEDENINNVEEIYKHQAPDITLNQSPKDDQNETSIDHEPSWIIYPLENYGIRIQDSDEETIPNTALNEMSVFSVKVDNFVKDGIGRSAAALMLTHRYLCPHVVLLQNDLTNEWMLPSCSYKAWENPRTVLANYLKSIFLSNNNTNLTVSSNFSGDNSGNGVSNNNNSGTENAVEVGEFLGTWWRTEFNYAPLPYLPPHSTRPKETIRIYQVILPPKLLFRLPRNYVLKSLPLFDLDPNIFGIACGSIPQLISRFQIQSMTQSNN
ncbi:NUDIX domain mRNA cleavage factor Im like [Cryptosporidium xiaoi]|uniref:Cleavage and polyadenylation specificity factor subunit 5 n=1 Tax=Cryptosporidium xiaoi TaxID=659607 RepID=A0AAV9XYZ6_9CRYT